MAIDDIGMNENTGNNQYLKSRFNNYTPFDLSSNKIKTVNIDESLKDLKILIVEDQELFSIGLMTLLNGYGFISKCDRVSNSKDAVKLLANFKYDIVFVDFQLRKMGGMELVRIIKRKYKKCKIIVITSMENKSDVHDFMDLEVPAFLSKDCEANELIHAWKNRLN